MKRFGLSEKERLKKKKSFDLVYSNGKTIYSHSRKLKAVFHIQSSHEESGVKAAFAVYRKAGKAVWRNRVKRLLRESFRLNKKIITDSLVNSGKIVFIVFSPAAFKQKTHAKLKLIDIEPGVTDILKQISKLC